MGVDNLSKIRNKIKRQELYRGAKIEKSKVKLAQRKERAQAEKQDPKLKGVQLHIPPISRCILTYIIILGTTENKYPSYS